MNSKSGRKIHLRNKEEKNDLFVYEPGVLI